MKEQISIVACIDAAALIEIVYMALECLALKEIRAQIGDDILLILRECPTVGMIVNRREIRAVELHAPPAAERHAGEIEVDLVQQQPILHLKVGIAADQCALELEHHHRNGTLCRLDGVLVGVDARGKCCERAQADAVAALQYVGIAVAETVADDRSDADLAAECRAHP